MSESSTALTVTPAAPSDAVPTARSAPAGAPGAIAAPARRRLPDERRGVTRRIAIQTPAGPVRMYATVGLHDDGTPGELFLKVDRQGSALSGFADAVAVSVSIGLQHGVPLALYVAKFRHTRFEPAGLTGGAEQPFASSLLDALAGWLERRFGSAS